MSPNARKTLVTAATLALLGSSAIGGFLLWMWRQPPTPVPGIVAGPCDLQRGPCRAEFPGGGSLQVSINPRPITMVTPLTVNVELNGLDARTVDISFTTPELITVSQRQRLTAADGNRFSGNTLLPVCVRDRMTWEMQVRAHNRRYSFNAGFGFVAISDPRARRH